MILWNSEEKKNNNIDVCRVTEGLKEKKGVIIIIIIIDVVGGLE